MISRPSFRSIVLAIVICWIAVLTAASLSPVDRYKVGLNSYSPQVGLFPNRRHQVLHWVSFGGLAFVLGMMGRNTKQRILAAVAAAGLGLIIEYLQHAIYSNPLETWDIRDDSCASAAGLAAVLFVVAMKGPRRSKAQ